MVMKNCNAETVHETKVGRPALSKIIPQMYVLYILYKFYF